MNPAERRGLTHGPAEARRGLVPKVVAAPPERVEGARLLRVHRVDVDAARAREDDVVWAVAESRHARIIPNLRLDVFVAPRLEEESQPLRAEVAPGAVVEHL